MKHACLRLRKSPGFAAAVILTLAIGIGANTTVFSVLNSVLLKPLPYPKSDQLVGVWLEAPGAAGLTNFVEGLRLSPSMYFTFSEQNRTFQSLGVWVTGTANVTGIAEPEQVHTALITDGVLQTLDVPPAAGRWLTGVDQDPRGAKAVMLSYGYWQRRFGGERSAIGRSITIDEQPREIVGVMPRGFRVVSADFDVLVPLAFDRNKQILAGFGFQGVGRLKPGVTIAQADADIARMVPVWMDSWTNGPGTNPHWYEHWRIAPAIRPLKQEVIGNIGEMLWVVMGTLAVVMLITCANVANLELVRAEARQQELAVRVALGAGRGRIARDLLTESVLLGLFGGIGGAAIAYGGLQLLLAIGPANLPRLNEITLDGEALLFTFVLSLLSGVLFGMIPVLRYAGSWTPAALQSVGRTASFSRERNHARNLLVVAQVAMALVLLVSAALDDSHIPEATKHRSRICKCAASGNDADLQFPILSSQAHRWSRDYRTILWRNSPAIPGVSSVGFASAMPMEGLEAGWDNIFAEGKTYAGEVAPLRLFNNISPGFFRTAGTRIVAGREFTWPEIYNRQPMVIVSENLAREIWGSPAAAIGKRIRRNPGMPLLEVIGVVQDIYQNGIQEKAPTIVYWPPMAVGYWGPGFDAIRSATFIVRSDRAGTESFLNELRQAVWSLNSSVPVASMRTMQDIYGQSLARTSFTLVMLGIAGAMALVLGFVGIYGVISYAVSQRTREIGIRLALGAERAKISRMVIGQGLRLALAGVAVGAVATLVLGRSFSSFSQLLYGVRVTNPAILAAVSSAVVIVAVVACYLPARRAASIEPMKALRSE